MAAEAEVAHTAPGRTAVDPSRRLRLSTFVVVHEWPHQDREGRRDEFGVAVYPATKSVAGGTGAVMRSGSVFHRFAPW